MDVHRFDLLVAGLLCQLSLLGCGDSGPQLVPMRGQVTIDGEPLRYGYLRFIPTSGRSSDAEIQDDGTFVLRYSEDQEGVLLGTHRIEVAANQVLSPSKVKWHAPKYYASIGTSGLKFDVNGPRDDLKVELTWGGKSGPYVEDFAQSGGL